MVAMVSTALIVAAIVFDRCEERKKQLPVPVEINTQVDSVKSHEFRSQHIIDSLNSLVGALKEKEVVDKKSVSFYQSENKRLKRIAESHIDSMGLFEPPDSTFDENDYAGNIRELTAAAAASDSACNERISTLDSINALQVKIIADKDELYSGIKNSFNVGIEQQKVLASENLKLHKKNKNKSTWIKVLAGITVVLSGILIAK